MVLWAEAVILFRKSGLSPCFVDAAQVSPALPPLLPSPVSPHAALCLLQGLLHIHPPKATGTSWWLIGAEVCTDLAVVCLQNPSEALGHSGTAAIPISAKWNLKRPSKGDKIGARFWVFFPKKCYQLMRLKGRNRSHWCDQKGFGALLGLEGLVPANKHTLGRLKWTNLVNAFLIIWKTHILLGLLNKPLPH